MAGFDCFHLVITGAEKFLFAAGLALAGVMNHSFVQYVVGCLWNPVAPLMPTENGTHGLWGRVPPSRQLAIHPNQDLAFPFVLAVAKDHELLQWTDSASLPCDC